jgi:hypothetical protein
VHAGDRRDQPFRFFCFGVVERHRQFGKFRMWFERRLENEFQISNLLSARRREIQDLSMFRGNTLEQM